VPSRPSEQTGRDRRASPNAPRVFCSELSQANGEPLVATASRIEHWLLVEYRGVWARDELRASLLEEPVKEHVRAQLAALPRSRLLFIRRPERRGRRGVAVFYGRTSEHGTSFHTLELDRHDELRSLDFAAALTHRAPSPGEPLREPLFVVCTHGKRDPCCARHGRPLYEGLREAADEGWVWQATHVGGDRFAGNLVCLPEGLYYGRVDRFDALPLLVDHLAGRIDVGHYRGRCWYSFPVQAAEREVRVRAGATGIDDLALAGVERNGDGSWRVRFRAREALHEVEVALEYGDLTLLTCSSATPKSPRRFRVRAVRTLP
jgi:hypothetical protein